MQCLDIMMAYRVMMTVRLVELHRVLKSIGSLYLHCDPTASHYLKIILDTIFGPQHFRNEIIWKRQSAHSDAKTKFADGTDAILFYVKSKEAKFHPQYGLHDPLYVEKFYRFDDKDGRVYYPRHKDGTIETIKRPAVKRYLQEQEGSINRAKRDSGTIYLS